MSTNSLTPSNNKGIGSQKARPQGTRPVAANANKPVRQVPANANKPVRQVPANAARPVAANANKTARPIPATANRVSRPVPATANGAPRPSVNGAGRVVGTVSANSTRSSQTSMNRQVRPGVNGPNRVVRTVPANAGRQGAATPQKGTTSINTNRNDVVEVVEMPSGSAPNTSNTAPKSKAKKVTTLLLTTLAAGAVVIAPVAIYYRNQNKTYEVSVEFQNKDGASESYSITLRRGATISSLKEMLSEQYGRRLVGIFKDPECKQEYSDSDKVTKDTKIYLKYEEITYSVNLIQDNDFYKITPITHDNLNSVAHGDYFGFTLKLSDSIQDKTEYDNNFANSHNFIKVYSDGVEIDYECEYSETSGEYTCQFKVEGNCEVRISDPIVDTYEVTLPSSCEAYRITFEQYPKDIKHGITFTFYVELAEKYSNSDFSVYVNGAKKDYKTQSGNRYSYEIKVTEDAQVTIEGCSVNTYTVNYPNETISNGDPYEIQFVDVETAIVWDGSLSFDVVVSNSYSQSNFTVCNGTVELTEYIEEKNEHGQIIRHYTIEHIKSDVNIVVDNLKKNTYSVKYKTTNAYSIVALEGTDFSNLTHGDACEFMVVLSDEYSGSEITVSVNDKVVNPIDGVDENGDPIQYYRVDHIEENIEISVGGIQINSYTVTYEITNMYEIESSDFDDIKHGDICKFTVSLNEAYDQSYNNMVVKVNGYVVDIQDGYYRFTATGDVEITVENIEINKYTIQLPVGETGYIITDENGNEYVDAEKVVEYGSELNFKVVSEYGYNLKNAIVQVGGVPLTANSEGNYSFIATKDVKITVTGVELNSYEVSYPSGEGYRIIDNEGFSIPGGIRMAQHGSSLSFKIELKTGYEESPVMVVINDEEVVKDENGYYNVESVEGAISIKVYRVTLNQYTITWINVDGEVLATTTVSHGDIPAYPYEDPTMPSTYRYDFKFREWDKVLVGATDDITYTAEFDAIEKASYKVSSNSSNVTFTVERSGLEQTLSSSDTVYEGENLKVSYKESEGCVMETFTIDGVPYVLGEDYALIDVAAGVSVLYTEVNAYGLTFTQDNDECYVTAFNGEYTSVVIPNKVYNRPVTIINDGVFAGTGLEEITICANIETIGVGAFKECDDLATVEFEEGSKLQVISKEAFASCGVLDAFEIVDGVTTIGDQAFINCASLTEITIPASVIDFGNDPGDSDAIFSGCTALKLVAFENGSTITRLGNGLFNGCLSLTNVILPTGLTSIGDYAFSECTNLKEIALPATVQSLGDYSFKSCWNLIGITIPSLVKEIGVNAFDGCRSLSEITIPSSVTTISDYTFKGCTGLVSVGLQSGLTAIGNYAFADCSALTGITIPSSVETIGEYSFENCTGLTTFTIPSNVKSIEVGAFSGCENISTVIINSQEIYSAATDKDTVGGLLMYADSIKVLKSIDNATNSYLNGGKYIKTQDGNYYTYTLAYQLLVNDTSVIVMVYRDGDWVDLYNNSLIYEGETLRVSYDETDNYVMETFTINGTEYKLDAGQYIDITVEDKVDIVYSETKSYGLTFSMVGNDVGVASSDGAVASVIIPSKVYNKTVTTILPTAFNSNKKLTSVEFADTITHVGNYAFAGCENLEYVKLSSNLNTMVQAAFYRCYSLSSIEIPANVVDLGSQSFTDCNNLTEVIINSSSIYSQLVTDTACGDLLFHAETVKVLKSIDNGSNEFLNSSRCEKTTSGNYNVYNIIKYSLEGLDDNVILTVERGGKTLGLTSNSWIYQGEELTVSYQASNGFVMSEFTINGEIAEDGDSVVVDENFEVTYSEVQSYGLGFDKLTRPDGSNAMGVRDFYGGYSNVIIPSKVNNKPVVTIDREVFSGIYSLKSVTIPTTIETIGEYAFSNTGLTSVTFVNPTQSRLRDIGDAAFAGAPLTSIAIPFSVEYIGASAFKNCQNLSSVTFGAGSYLTDIGAEAFEGTGLTSIVIPERVTQLGDEAFGDCHNLTNVTINSGSVYREVSSSSVDRLLLVATEVSVLKSIADDTANYQNAYLNGYYKTESGSYYTYHIGQYQLKIETSGALVSVNGNSNIGACVVNAGEPLSLYYSLEPVSNHTPYLSQFLVNGVARSNDYVFTPASTGYTNGQILVKCTAYSNSNDLEFNFYSGYVEVSGAKNSRIISLTIPSYINNLPVYKIADNAFSSFTDLTIVNISSESPLRTIGKNAFYNCTSLTSITIPRFVETIGTAAFSGCQKLTTVNLSSDSSLRTIGENAFYNCTSLTSITIPRYVETIGTAAFSGCQKLTTIIIESSQIYNSLTSSTACGNLISNATESTLKIAKNIDTGNEFLEGRFIFSSSGDEYNTYKYFSGGGNSGENPKPPITDNTYETIIQ